MIPMTVEEIRAAMEGRWCSRSADMTAEAVCTDSRTAAAGEVFVAIRGCRLDGHDYLWQASEAGCVAAVVDRDSRHADLAERAAHRFTAGIIAVRNTVKALGMLASEHRNRSAATSVVAVTGSNGKTTVKRMIGHILAKRLAGTCSPKSFNNEIGVPVTLLGVRPGDDYVVCEVGSSAPGEIDALGRMIRPNVGVITSVGPTHLEKLKSPAQVAVEKASLLNSVQPGGLAVVWGDSEELNRAVRAYRGQVVRFGRNKACQLRLTDYRAIGRTCRFELNERLWVDLPLPGLHNAMNAAAAIAVAQRLGFEHDRAAAALADFVGAAMRLEWVEAGQVTIINDAYNANPSSVLAAAEVLGDQPGKRRVLVVGDMRELGQAAEQLHLQAGRDIASRNLDLLIGVGALGRYIAVGAGRSALATECFDTVDELADQIGAVLAPGDVVLVKGSRAMGMERLVRAIEVVFQK